MNNAEFRQWLASRLDRLEETQVDIKNDLAEHMRRTELAEVGLEQLRAEVKPLTTHVAVVAAVFKVLIGLGSLASAVYGVMKLFFA